jgi:hypothetical protein
VLVLGDGLVPRVELARARALVLQARMAIVMASAAAVASSNMEAFVISIPVRLTTMVWKFISASRRPWEISA